jgi:hypothetical protein
MLDLFYHAGDEVDVAAIPELLQPAGPFDAGVALEQMDDERAVIPRSGRLDETHPAAAVERTRPGNVARDVVQLSLETYLAQEHFEVAGVPPRAEIGEQEWTSGA